jgi:hypothetical protein
MAPERADGALKLRAADGDDLAVISACLQDALVAVGDIAYVPEDESFVFVANRFRWEGDWGTALSAEGYQRILCAVAFDEVKSVLYRGFRRDGRERILSLLAVRPEFAREGGGAIHLDFSDGATIRLEVRRILCRVKDVGLPWPTRWRPLHDLGERR